MKKKINIEEAFNIKSFKTTRSFWACRDWAGPHVFKEKPYRINSGSKDEEWFSEYTTILDESRGIIRLVDKFTKGWDVDHKPEQITIEIEITF